MVFSEHGYYKMSTLDTKTNTILLVAEGPYNLEVLKRFHDELEQIVNGFAGEPWSQITVLKGLSTFTPEVFEALKSHFRWLKISGIVSIGVVFEEAVGSHITQEQIQILLEFSNVRGAFFDSVADAQSWGQKQYELPKAGDLHV